MGLILEKSRIEDSEHILFEGNRTETLWPNDSKILISLITRVYPPPYPVVRSKGKITKTFLLLKECANQCYLSFR